MRGIGLSRGGFWGFLALAFALGLMVGIGLLMWQRTAFLSDVKVLEKRLADETAQQKDVSEEVEDLRETLSSREASLDALAEQNTSLTAELASSTAALAAAKAAAVTATTTAPTGPVSISGHDYGPKPVPAGGQYTITATVRGAASKVTVRVFDVQANLNYKKDFGLTRVSSSGGTETWQVTLSGPAAGHYHYWVYAYVGSKEVARNTKGGFSSN